MKLTLLAFLKELFIAGVTFPLFLINRSHLKNYSGFRRNWATVFMDAWIATTIL